MTQIDHIAGVTYHGRHGAIKNAFRYGIDYVLLDAEAPVNGPSLFRRNGANVMSLHDVDHGGFVRVGRGAAWVRDVLAKYDVDIDGRIDLLAQPRVLGYVFNPVAFWLCHNANGALVAVIAEVSNTFGQRHSYLCHHADLRPISRDETLQASKIFHVSPFQPIDGTYTFGFDIRPDYIHIVINYEREDGGLVASLKGPRTPLTNKSILQAAWKRPLGARRVLALIHWQAVKLWWKKATYRPCPPPLDTDVSK